MSSDRLENQEHGNQTIESNQDDAKNLIGRGEYSKLADSLRKANDAQFGIVSKHTTMTVGAEKKDVWLRDARKAKELNDRISHDSPTIEGNNVLLRVLSRLRPIDFVLEKKFESEPTLQLTFRNKLQEKFTEFYNNVMDTVQNPPPTQSNKDTLKELTRLENEINTTLVEVLHDADLTGGCARKADAEKLLGHYRSLSSVLEPARIMVTVTYDEKNGILHRETQYPVTQKTDAQKEALKDLDEINPYPDKKNKNSFNRKRLAFQQADYYFREQLSSDETALGAQARKTHLVGAKNAFIVKNELVSVNEDANKDLSDEALLTEQEAAPENTLWLARSGSPAFIGKGETNKRVLEQTQENIDQIRATAKNLMGKERVDIHVTTLNTVSPLENQATIVKNVKNATRNNQDNQDDYSYVPLNPDGTFRRVDIAPNLQFKNTKRPSGSAPFQRATRLDTAVSVVLEAAQTENTLSLVHCASGQDRTGVLIEKSIEGWERQRYQEAMGKNAENLPELRAKGGNAAEITTHHIHGSPGMKLESRPKNVFGGRETFSKEEAKEFFLKSAGSNKKNKVQDVSFLSEAPEQLSKTIKNRLLTLTNENNTLRSGNREWRNSELLDLSGKILQEIIKINEMPGISLNDKRDLNDTLDLMIKSVQHLSKNTQQTHNHDIQKIGQRLEGLGNRFQKKGFWATGLGKLLTKFANLFRSKAKKEVQSKKESLGTNMQAFKERLLNIEGKNPQDQETEGERKGMS